MKKQFYLLIIISIFSQKNLFAQISFESGYFIDNNGQKSTVFIKNLDWKNNPKELIFKVQESGPSEEKQISEVAEFGIGNELKFVRALVQIDKSSNLESFLSTNKNPEFVTETLFLKALVEGKAKLYQYEEKNLLRFFYSKYDGEINQLIYKKYRIPQGIAQNKFFINQLSADLNYGNKLSEDLEKISYKAKDLENYFIGYNKFNNSEPIIFNKVNTPNPFHLYLRSGLIFSSFSAEKVSPDQRLYPFENPLGLHMGVQFEYVLPYRHNSWALLFEVNYHRITSNGTNNPETQYLDFRAIEFPLGAKYYFLDKNWGRLYANTAFVITKNLDSSIQLDDFNIELTKNHRFLTFGFGYSANRLQIEYRRDVPRNLDYFYPNWRAMINNNYILVGFRLF